MGFNYPVMLDMENKEVLIIGGGLVALRKLRLIRRTGAHVTVIAKDVCPMVAEKAEKGEIKLIQRSFAMTDINLIRPFFVCAATDDAQLNSQIAGFCQSQGMLVNTITEPGDGNVIVQASIDRGQFAVNISTFGQSPGFSRALRQYLETFLDKDLNRAVAIYIEIRKWLFDTESDTDRRGELLKRLSLADIRRMIADGTYTNEEITERVKEWLSC